MSAMYSITDSGFFRVGGPAQQCLARRLARFGNAAVARGGHDGSQALHPLREFCRQHLRDHAAQRGADDMRALQPEPVHQADGVAGHVRQGIGRAYRQAQRGGGHGQQQVAALLPRDTAGQPGVAVVEADHAVAARHQRLAEAVGPVRELHAEAHDQHDGRPGRVAQRFVLDVQRRVAQAR
jgi:hypothetical protein